MRIEVLGGIEILGASLEDGGLRGAENNVWRGVFGGECCRVSYAEDNHT